ncbi:UNVERIFIED_ORG: AcrR family transcriptional regulator [Burkholderia cepacia]|nr:TetR family transcriptional regulator [Burkholderia cenocepacia]MDP9543969.1 AcrR family transcriptional regulator [Burkholderia cepacia]CDN60248.1 transcriptional regulator, TetR family [Burkholderia cenocepacia H111]MDP9593960.1 AcrR family transcriptional regulator [Burkholderia cepacia]MDP9621558.1 AcrR family transcriptional regulator [Burkholderia cepacia]
MKKGYVAASVEDIAAAAGYTRGAFYSNFRSKSDLLLELLERDHAAVRADFEVIFEGGGTREQMESMALAYYRTLFRDDEYSLLWGEAKLQAARDAKFRVRFNQFLHGKRVQMAEFIQRFAERAGTPLLLPADTLAFGLMCLCDGVQSYYTADPQHVSADVAESVLAGFFARVVLGRAPD